MSDSACRAQGRERVPLPWNPTITREPLKIKGLEHVRRFAEEGLLNADRRA